MSGMKGKLEEQVGAPTSPCGDEVGLVSVDGEEWSG